MRDSASVVKWYQTEQEIKSDSEVSVYISNDEIEKVRKNSGGKIPEERLMVIARNQVLNAYSKDVLKAQSSLLKSDFNKVALEYLSMSIDECLESDEILLNIFALMDRRVGKKRIAMLEKKYQLKHPPAVRYIYNLRRFG